MKDIYINVPLQPRVICLDVIYENDIIPLNCKNFITAQCKCQYFVHKSCFHTWKYARPTDDVRCLICKRCAVS